jgi:6-phosphogluconolactonase (cycloisomerase 2 family)
MPEREAPVSRDHPTSKGVPMNVPFKASTCVFFPALLLTACSAAPAPDGADGTSTTSEAIVIATAPGFVFTETNAVESNELVAYKRAVDGTLSLSGRVETGGAGVGGGGLTAQGAIGREGRWLFVTNAGSDDVTTFDLASGAPVAVARTASGGTEPVSVTVRSDGLVYVLNAGGPGGIAGFRVDGRGRLDPIAGSAQPLSGTAVTPTEVSFTPGGDTLVVTERDGGKIDTYRVDARGRAGAPTFTESDGPSPFGFSFTPVGELVVSEAASSAASAYAILGGTRVVSITASVPNTQKAACWLVVAPGGLEAFTANAGSGTLSSYRIGFAGRLSLDSAVAGDTGAGSHPVDMAFGDHGRYLYSLANTAGTITAFRVEGGNLTAIGSVGSLPASASGLVAL